MFALVVSAAAVVGGCPNQPPTATAGNDIQAVVGHKVTLSAAGSSDPDQQAITFLWQQTGGPSVSLSDPTASVTTFVPTVAGKYTFRITVTDTQNTSSSDVVRVTVTSSSNSNSNTNSNSNSNSNDNSGGNNRSEEHTSELQSHSFISYA